MNRELYQAIGLLQREKGIPAQVLCEKICTAVATAAKKEFGIKSGIFCEIDENFDLQLFLRKTAVEEVMDPESEISLEEAREYKENVVPSEIIQIPLRLKNLGRIAAQSVKNIMRQSVEDIRREQILKDFQSKYKEAVTVTVTDIRPDTGDVIVDMSGNEAVLTKKMQLPNETLKVGDSVKVYVLDVRPTDRRPKIIISRTSPELVKRLFEKEVPEIYDGNVEIMSIAREAGSRTKIAVWSKDENVDPVGSCIGARGSRVNAVIDAIGGEKIDIIKYSEDPAAFISAALAPADVVSVEIISEDPKACRVTVPETQLSLAIGGNKGQNARLAARLTGWKIDIVPYYGEKPLIQL
ncbi:MAG: transcription termination/antitermination protein NusA [Clostridia bacterium]|nr:transcription termination/antitermination protein NusA [Clostridia bacterium]MBR0509746.1 transcription termination/antitermination protein NusA [Clostridia bacterium]